MVPRIQILLLGWVLLFFFSVPSQSRPTGASSCVAGGPAVQGSHLLGSPGLNGTLQEGGFSISVNGVPQKNSTITVASLEFDLMVSGRGYKGILIRVGGAEADQVVTSSRGLTSEVAICGNVGAVTHISNNLKPTATASISLDKPGVLQVDITIVILNNSTSLQSIFYYYGLTIQVVAESETPSLSPISATKVTFPPRNSTSNAPSNAPIQPASNTPSAIPTTNTPAESVVEIIARNPKLLLLEEAATRAGIINSLSDPFVNFTLFAPHDEAFNKIDAKYLESANWTIHLRSILAYHVVPRATYLSIQLSNDREMNTVLEENVVVSRDAQGGIALSGPFFESQVLQADALAENGVVHVVDTVFLPPFLEQSIWDVLNVETGFFSAFIDLLTEAGVDAILTDMESEYTLLVPTNQAILALDSETKEAMKNDTELLLQVLSHHVIIGIYPSDRLKSQTELETFAGMNISVNVTEDGGIVFLNNRTAVIGPDAGVAGNGLISVLGSVLLPSTVRVPLTSAPTLSPSPTPVILRPSPPTVISPNQSPAVPPSLPSSSSVSSNMTDAPAQGQTSPSAEITSYATYFHCGFPGLFVLLAVLIAH